MNRLIEKHRLIPHPEGGYFRETHRSDQTVVSPVTGEKRNAATHIYFLLGKGQISRFHRVAHDEIWNFYEGAPLRIITFDGDRVEETVIGRHVESYVFIAKGGVFQAAESTGEYTLAGCVVAPGFDFKDFLFLWEDQKTLNRFKANGSGHDRFL